MHSTINKRKFFIGAYLTILISLLLCVIATPLLIQHEITISQNIIIEEEILEIMLIVILFVLSYLTIRSFIRTLNVYKSEADQAFKEKSTLVSRLSEAFHYIGCVNSEFHSIQSILSGVNHYPKSKREFKKLLDHLTAKAASIAATPWAAIRIINKSDGRTVKEHALEVIKETLPTVTVGNRTILERRQVKGFIIIGANHNNVDLRTVCIVPTSPLSKEESLLLTVIANQAEMYYLLYRTCIHHQDDFFPYPPSQERKLCHDTTF